MKMLIRDYLASLRERDELDAVLPELLAEAGYRVYSRPGRGTQQGGVDVAAIGKTAEGEEAVFLFTVKPGNLSRRDWSSDSPQALKPSLEDILDVYIRNRIPSEFRRHKIVVCIVIGGEVHEHMREKLTGFFERHSTSRISFQEWDGDRLTELVLNGLLREEVLPTPLRSAFRKSVAMVDEPETAIEHFSTLTRALLDDEKGPKARVRAARQLCICTWVLFTWARGAGNLEAAYRASEISLLATWELLRRSMNKKQVPNKDIVLVLHQAISLHITVAQLFVTKVTNIAGVLHGASTATGARSPLDVNLALFEMLGRIGLLGQWLHWFRAQAPENAANFQSELRSLAEFGAELINNNPALFLPAADMQTTSIALFLQLWISEELDTSPIRSWLVEMSGRLGYTVKTRGAFPSCATEYADLDEHLSGRSDEEQFKEATAGSTLIPTLAAWLHALGEKEAYENLAELTNEDLSHCTLQLWVPDESSEPALFVGGQHHGKAISGLDLRAGGEELISGISKACAGLFPLERMSPVAYGYWPILFVAFHLQKLPIPPSAWISALQPAATQSGGER